MTRPAPADGYLTRARLVLPDGAPCGAAVRIRDGVIDAIDPASGQGLPEIDAEGGLVLPGLVDLHGDAIEQECLPRPKVAMPLELALEQLDRRAAANGITTAYHAITFADEAFGMRNPADAVRAVRAVCAFRGLVEHRVHARYEITDAAALAALLPLVAEGAVDLVSVMDHGPGQGQFPTQERYAAYLGGRFGVPAETAAAIAARKLAARAGAPTRLAQLAAAAQAGGIPLASHDDDAPAAIARGRGLGVSISEFPLSLAVAAEARAQGMRTLFGAPNLLRGQSQGRGPKALDAILADLCDCLCTDYHPGTLLEAVVRLPALAPLTLGQSAALASTQPAAAAGLDDRGRLAVGMRADLLVLRRTTPTARLAAVVAQGRVVLATRDP